MVRPCNRTGARLGLPGMGCLSTAPGRTGPTTRAPGDIARTRPGRLAASLAIPALLLGGCASFSPDAGLSVAGGYAALDLRKDIVKADDQGIAPTADARVDALLRRPIGLHGQAKAEALRVAHQRGQRIG